jgi:hypothetical protein
VVARSFNLQYSNVIDIKYDESFDKELLIEAYNKDNVLVGSTESTEWSDVRCLVNKAILPSRLKQIVLFSRFLISNLNFKKLRASKSQIESRLYDCDTKCNCYHPKIGRCGKCKCKIKEKVKWLQSKCDLGIWDD